MYKVKLRYCALPFQGRGKPYPLSPGLKSKPIERPSRPHDTRGDSCAVSLFCSGRYRFFTRGASRHQLLDANSYEHGRDCGQAHQRNHIRVGCLTGRLILKQGVPGRILGFSLFLTKAARDTLRTTRRSQREDWLPGLWIGWSE